MWCALRWNLTKFEISTFGYGIHWPLLDEDMSIDGLLGPDLIGTKGMPLVS